MPEGGSFTSQVLPTVLIAPAVVGKPGSSASTMKALILPDSSSRSVAISDGLLARDPNDVQAMVEDVVERDVFNHARAVKRRRGNRRVRTHKRTRRVSSVSTRSRASRPRRFPNTQLRFFTNQVFRVANNLN